METILVWGMLIAVFVAGFVVKEIQIEAEIREIEKKDESI